MTISTKTEYWAKLARLILPIMILVGLMFTAWKAISAVPTLETRIVAIEMKGVNTEKDVIGIQKDIKYIIQSVDRIEAKLK